MSETSVIENSGPADTSGRKIRKVRTGTVTARSGDKTVRVQFHFQVKHPKYGKFIRRRKVGLAHDERNEAQVGDKVEMMECRPISKRKTWRLMRVVERL